MSEVQVLIAAVAVLLAYMVLALRLSQAAQAWRMEIASTGEHLLADESVPQDVKRHIAMLMEATFSGKIAWLIVFLHPIAAVGSRFRRTEIACRKARIPPEHVAEVESVYLKGLACILSNSPLAAALFVLEWLILNVLLHVGRGMSATIQAISTVRAGGNGWRKHIRHS